MTVTLLIGQLPAGVGTGVALTAALAVVLLGFGAGYWYLVKRNHQADEVSDDYADDRRESQD